MEISQSINYSTSINVYFLNLELIVKSLTHQVISKALLSLSLEDNHNYILTQLKKNQLIRSPELCMVHKKTHIGLLIYFFSYYTKLCHIVL